MTDLREYHPEGVFTAETMDSLLDEIAVPAGLDRVQVHMEGVSIVLAEAAEALQARLAELLESGLTEVQFDHLSEAAQLQFQFYGIPVQKKTARILISDLALEKEVLPSDDVLVRTCFRCSHKMKIFGSGTYACPSCGVRFYADTSGRMEFYESLQSVQK